MQIQPLPQQTPYRPALRLINTKSITHDEWLDVRKQGIGSSDAAAAIGLNPYQSQLELWMIKTGRDTASMPSEDSAGYAPIHWHGCSLTLTAKSWGRMTYKPIRHPLPMALARLLRLYKPFT